MMVDGPKRQSIWPAVATLATVVLVGSGLCTGGGVLMTVFEAYQSHQPSAASYAILPLVFGGPVIVLALIVRAVARSKSKNLK